MEIHSNQNEPNTGNSNDVHIIKLGGPEQNMTINNITIKKVNQNFQNVDKLVIKNPPKTNTILEENEDEKKEEQSKQNEENIEANINKDKPKNKKQSRLRAQRTKAPKKYLQEKEKEKNKKSLFGIFACCLANSGNNQDDED